MVLDGWRLIYLFYFVDIISMSQITTTSNFNCPSNCRCELQSYKVNCSAANVTDSTFQQINERIEYFDLSFNNLERVPGALLTTYFEHITHLNLSFNKISTIHRYAFARIYNLKNLDLSNNNIKSFLSISADSAFLGHSKLHTLNLSGNPLLNLGEDENQILYSESLHKLDVSHCLISYIQGALVFQGLPKLVSLNLAHNPLTRIEGFFSNSLISLDISDSKIQFLHSDSIDNLKRLRELRISNNQRLTDQYDKLSSKSVLYLDASFCSIYSNYASDLPEAQTVILKGNLIKTIPVNAFQNNTKLENLDLSNNRISFIHELAFLGAESLQFLDLSANAISVLAENTFSYTPFLSYLNLSNNHFHSVSTIKAPSIIHLDLSFCRIETIVANAFIQTPSLKIFNISNNSIEKLPDNFSSKSLQVLNAAYCRIIAVNSSKFYKLSALRELDLSGNRLVHIKNTTFANNNYLKSVNLADNPWKCDCQDENFYTLWTYLTQPMKIQDKSMLICQYPENVTNWTWENACSTEWSRDSKKRKDVIVLLIIVTVLFVSGIMACVFAIRENCAIYRSRARSNDVLEHSGTVRGPQGENSENDALMTESIRKLTQLPSYDEALLLPRPSSVSSDSEIIARSSRNVDKLKKRQSATQTDESIIAFLQQISTKQMLENDGPDASENETRRIRRRSWDEIEYINITTLPVQSTEL